MLGKDEIKEILNSVDKKALAQEIIEAVLIWRYMTLDDAVIYAELDLETGEIEVKYRADFALKPQKEKGLWIAKFITHNMDEIPDDLPDEIKNADDVIATYYRLSAEYYVEFIEDYDIEDKLRELMYTESSF